MPSVFDSFFGMNPKRYQNSRQAPQNCCNDPYCENNYPRTARRPQTSQRLPFGSLYEDDFLGYGARPTPTKAERRPTTSFTNPYLRETRPKQQPYTPTEQQQWWTDRDTDSGRGYVREPKVHRTHKMAEEKPFRAEDDKENYVPRNQRVEPKVSAFVPTQSRTETTPVTAKKSQVKQNKPKFYSQIFETNSISKNGKSKTLKRATVQKDDSVRCKSTKIYEDNEGNRNVTRISPKNYEKELKTIWESMEENDQIIREVNPAIATEYQSVPNNDDDGMLEEIRLNKSFDSNCSNTDSGNTLFDEFLF